MLHGSALIGPRRPLGTIYRSEALISRTVAENLQECPDCGHEAHMHTLAGCLISRDSGPQCLCEVPRDEITDRITAQHTDPEE